MLRRAEVEQSPPLAPPGEGRVSLSRNCLGCCLAPGAWLLTEIASDVSELTDTLCEASCLLVAPHGRHGRAAH